MAAELKNRNSVILFMLSSFQAYSYTLVWYTKYINRYLSLPIILTGTMHISWARYWHQGCSSLLYNSASIMLND
ncbi:hypothetical protein F4777DRAFT_290808 [Nemania sp. FL0916]|nr:hypothetical protein F4777DRAFT_290808 [Nemania sp. FL0916]